MPKIVRFSTLAFLLSGVIAPLTAQEDLRRALTVTRLEATPSSVVMTQGESVRFTVAAFDASGNVVDVHIRIVGAFRGVRYEDGRLTAFASGEHLVFAAVALPPDADREPPRLQVSVRVNWPAVERIELAAEPGTLYQGTTIFHEATAYHGDGSSRPDVAFEWRSADPSVAWVDRFGYVRGESTGTTTITATFQGVIAQRAYRVESLTATQLEIVGGEDEVHTGDVQNFSAVTRDDGGRVVDGVAVTWTLAFKPEEGIIAPSAPGQIIDGNVVADVPGVYTVMASAGPITANRRFTVVKRDVIQRVKVVGHGRQTTHYTSDLWIFEGVDGRDYALTGARQAQSHAFVWDVTDPSNIFKTDSIQVDARSLNDVKVSPNGRYAAISREGASNRRNGVVILDLSNPAHPTIASTFDENGLTGGVHNLFATNDYLFALANSDKYVILDVRDIYDPKYVSEYNHPDSRVHDVWIHDGVAYSAEWQNGVVAVDVGNGRWGGSIENPKLIGVYPIPTGQTHAVFPYVSESTGKFYLFVGDEIVSRRGLAWEGNGPDHRQPYDPETGRGGYPRATSGYIQILDMTDPEKPKMVARLRSVRIRYAQHLGRERHPLPSVLRRGHAVGRCVG